MATWSLVCNLTTGTLAASNTDRVWWNGSTFGTNVIVGNYQDSTHLTDDNDVHLCTTYHVHNTKYLTPTTMSLDGGSSANLSTLTQGNTGLVFNFSDTSSNVTSGGIFYAYDGTTDLNPINGVTLQAAEGQVSTSWIVANGSGSALNLADQTASTSHNFYIATSVTPTSNGAKVGKIKVAITYT